MYIRHILMTGNRIINIDHFLLSLTRGLQCNGADFTTETTFNHTGRMVSFRDILTWTLH